MGRGQDYGQRQRYSPLYGQHPRRPVVLRLAHDCLKMILRPVSLKEGDWLMEHNVTVCGVKFDVTVAGVNLTEEAAIEVSGCPRDGANAPVIRLPAHQSLWVERERVLDPDDLKWMAVLDDGPGAGLRFQLNSGWAALAVYRRPDGTILSVPKVPGQNTQISGPGRAGTRCLGYYAAVEADTSSLPVITRYQYAPELPS